MAYGEDRADVYANLMRDNEEDIIKRMDIDTILDEFPCKEYISESEFRSLTTETNSFNKSKRFVNIVLNKKKEPLLEAFLQLVEQGNPGDSLLLKLRDRIARFDGEKEKNNPDASSDESLPSASIYNESEVSADNCHVRTKDELEDDLKTARTVIVDKIEEIERLEGVNSRLQDEVGELKTEREELQRENTGLKENNDTLQRQSNTLNRENTEVRNNNAELKTQLESAKIKIDELETALHSHTDQIQDLNRKYNTVCEELEPLKKLIQEIKSKESSPKAKSKICSLM